MSGHNHVTMNIPDNNPLFQWVINAARGDAAIPYVKVSVGEISARLQLCEVPAIHDYRDGLYGDETRTVMPGRYLETSWRLLRDAP